MKYGYAVIGFALAFGSPAFAAKPCDGLKGTAKTQCLKSQLAREQGDAAYYGAYTNSIDKTIKQGCKIQRGMDSASGVAGAYGEASGNHAATLGSGAYDAGRAAGDKLAKPLTGSNNPC